MRYIQVCLREGDNNGILYLRERDFYLFPGSELADSAVSRRLTICCLINARALQQLEQQVKVAGGGSEGKAI